MNITNQFKKFISLYNEEIANVNNVLRINFIYNNCHGFISYQNSLNLKNTLTIVWQLDDNNFCMQSYCVKLIGAEYHFNPYLDNNIFRLVYPKLRKIPNPLIDFFEVILNRIPDEAVETMPIRNLNQYHNNNNNVDYIYFYCLKRVNMANEMFDKVSKYFNEQIASFIKNNGYTCVFTNDIMKAKDFKYKVSTHPDLKNYRF